jgi:methylated-DNA-protein-cysteine methyltransferase related protein
MGFSSPPDRKQFEATVWEIVRQIPPGKVSAYGQIAGLIPPPGTLNLREYETFGARWVGGAMANCPEDVPWQRVINAQGRISERPGSGMQRQLLESEGIEFTDSGRVDFNRFGWQGPDSEWRREHGLFAPKPLGKPQAPLF